MADLSTAGDLFRSRILGMGLEDTPYPQQAVAGMLGGATPEQIGAFFQSPQVQQQFKSFGVDPQALLQHVRQSPFFSQGFMQAHPQLGGALSRAFANVASTPEAPLVSGAGSGMTRAMQGAFGGPEMLRQYQLHQMMAPLGAIAGMMPTYGEERRRAIEQAIVDETKERMQALPMQQQMQQELADIKRGQEQAQFNRSIEPQVHQGPYGITTNQYQPGQGQGMEPGQAGLLMEQQGGRLTPGFTPPPTGSSAAPTIQQFQTPGYALAPASMGGWNTSFQPYDPNIVSDITQSKETPAQRAQREGAGRLSSAKGAEQEGETTAGMPGARVGEQRAKSEQERATAQWRKSGNAPGGHYAQDRDDRFAKQYNDAERHAQDMKTAIDAQVAAKTMSAQEGERQKQIWDHWLVTQKSNIDNARSKPGESARGKQTTDLPNQVAPNAPNTPGRTQQGGAPAAGAGGLPAGYEFNQQGIPVPIKTAPAPQQ